MTRIDRIEGTAIPLRGNDVDTDRIVPARFLRSVTFEGLEAHVFEDDRRATDRAATMHPFSNAAFRGASILLVNRNFGCGSSREHAPQALQRWGICAVVGESFSEIFFGNSLALGMPCVTVGAEAIQRLMERVEQLPATRLIVDLDALTVEVDGHRIPTQIAPAAREAFLTGAWDATGLLLENFEQVRALATRLPYARGFG